MKVYITTDETDWGTEFGVYALFRDSRLYENTSAVKGYTVEIFEGMDEGDVSNILAQRLREGKDYDYTLYDGQHCLIGFAYYGKE